MKSRKQLKNCLGKRQHVRHGRHKNLVDKWPKFHVRGVFGQSPSVGKGKAKPCATGQNNATNGHIRETLTAEEQNRARILYNTLCGNGLNIPLSQSLYHQRLEALAKKLRVSKSGKKRG